MCGLYGMLALDSSATPTEAQLRRIGDAIHHRGPDDGGVLARGPIGLSFRRLAILDLEPTGHQPMLDEDADLAIVFNGEVFNYLELRAELAAKGHVFRSSGDTAVVLAAYKEWGAECLTRFVGMFGIILCDFRRQRLLVARDRFGVKPVYVHRTAQALEFASEIKAIRASGLRTAARNDARFAALLAHGRADALPMDRETFAEGIQSIPPGTYWDVPFSGAVREVRYWAPPSEPDAMPFDRAVTEYRERFDTSVRLRMRADVPVGVMLSGGVDSTSIACTMAELLGPAAGRTMPLHAFCYQSEDFDESPQLEATIAQTGATVHRMSLTPEAIWDSIPAVLWHHDEPVHGPSVLMGFELYRVARAHGVIVVLGGQGADETAGGYGTFFNHMLVSLALSGRIGELRREVTLEAQRTGRPARAIWQGLALRLRGQALAGVAGFTERRLQRERFAAPHRAFLTEDFAALVPTLRPVEPRQDLHAVLRFATAHGSLAHYLRAEDRSSMAHSIEARVPFLDHRLVEHALRQPATHLMGHGWNKRLVREAMRGRIPEIVRARREKFGFPTSVRRWFAGPWAERAERELLDGPLGATGWLRMDRLRDALTAHRAGSADHSSLLFTAVQCSIWLRLDASGWARPT
ncbi:MAG: asparagine synthase (glutamine-hydrolyzing) [Gemmatimonadaceae bacterium]|nr:asparagine synthase (glutamine-hydrolyzing) [Gemmatimonadaceae bacterium]